MLEIFLGSISLARTFESFKFMLAQFFINSFIVGSDALALAALCVENIRDDNASDNIFVVCSHSRCFVRDARASS